MCSRNKSQTGLFYLSDAELVKFCEPHSSYLPEKSAFKNVILNRSELRALLGARAFYQPDFFCADTFEKISAWVVKQNQFPLLLKSDINGCNSENIFLLKAFRELPEFFEKIREDVEGNLIIEKFVPAKARIEATFFNEAIVLVSQVSLDKSLKCRHAWRAFPLNLPKAYLQEVKNFAQKNSDLINLKNVPIRITFAINVRGLIPLSVNPGYNRLEYFPAWGDGLRATKTTDASSSLNKLLFFYLSDRQLKNLNITELEAILADSLCRFWPGNLSAVWLKTSSNQIMKDDSKKAAVFFNAIYSEDSE
ncbi:MAG: hypothetical protein ACQETH_10625 [Candidatus Rifleibacteriota bacterium]